MIYSYRIPYSGPADPEHATKHLTLLRGSLADEVTDEADFATLDGLVIDIAYTEGARDAAAAIQEADGEYAHNLLQHALRSNDTWSGRGNDSRRAYDDGYRAMTTQHLKTILLGMLELQKAVS